MARNRQWQALSSLALAILVVMAPPFATSGVSQQEKLSRFAVPVAPERAAMLKREEDQAMDRAEKAVREMPALATTQPERELAASDLQIVAEVRRLVQRRQAVRSSIAAQGRAEQMQEIQMSFNLQYLALQNQLQEQSRQFTLISNIMKTKHETVKNSIGNIR